MGTGARSDPMKWKSWQFGKYAQKLPVIRDLVAWAAEKELPCRPVYPGSVAERCPSRSLPDSLRELLDQPSKFLVRKRREWDLTKFSRLYTGEFYEVPPTWEVEIPNAWLHVPSGTVITSEREVLAPSTLALKCFYQGHSEVSWDEAPWIEEPQFLLATVWGKNYAHWLFDALPRASRLAEHPGATALIDRAAPGFQEESLALGWGKVPVKVPESSLVRCKNIILHVASARSGVPNPEAIRMVRDRLISAIVPPADAKPRRIYISRQGTRRRIVNHPEVMQVLSDFGFEEVFCERLSFTKQVEMFSNCEAILGAHGAGTLNALFAPSGAVLIELFNPAVWDHAAHRVASLVGVGHWHLFAGNSGREFDMEVDPDRLERLLERALPGTRPVRGEIDF